MKVGSDNGKEEITGYRGVVMRNLAFSTTACHGCFREGAHCLTSSSTSLGVMGGTLRSNHTLTLNITRSSSTHLTLQ